MIIDWSKKTIKEEIDKIKFAEGITSQLSQAYNMELVETYNLNVGSKKKERLIRQFYLVSKK